MGVPYKHPRGTRAALNALASGANLIAGQVYLITDESRIVVALTSSTYETFAKQAEASKHDRSPGTGGGVYPNATYPAAITYSATTGYNDLYTVPTGRRALVRDYIMTNFSGSTVVNSPAIKIGSTYFKTGNGMTENTNGVGHNYGHAASGNRGMPIVLNAGETFAVNCDIAGMTIWCDIIEYDDTGGMQRADIQTFVNGENTLFTVPTGKTVSFGTAVGTSTNTPVQSLAGLAYVNNTGSNVTLSGIWLVPSGGSTGNSNRFVASNTVFTGSGFYKYFPGNLPVGCQIVMNVNSTTAGQFAWLNYIVS